MARCKCAACDASLNTSTAYRVDVPVKKKTGEQGVKPRYYCSEEEYVADEERKKKAADDKDRVYYLICEIMGEQEIIDTILWKEWKVWNKVADNEKIAKYLAENKEYLAGVIGRLQSSESARIRYLSTIIRGRIKGFVPRVEVNRKSSIVVSGSSFELFEPTIETQPKIEKQVLYDVEDDLI